MIQSKSSIILLICCGSLDSILMYIKSVLYLAWNILQSKVLCFPNQHELNSLVENLGWTYLSLGNNSSSKAKIPREILKLIL